MDSLGFQPQGQTGDNPLHLCDNRRMMTTLATTKVLRALIAIPLLVLLSGCSLGSPGDDDPTPTPAAPAGVTATVGAAATITIGERPDGSLSGLTQNLSLNGCRVTLPIEWVSEGDGTGTTPSRARFTLFGGSIASNPAWENAVTLVANQANRQGATTLERGGDWVMATLSGDRGFTFRARFDDRYCDFSVSSVRAIPESERNAWNAIAGSLEAAPIAEQTPEA